MSAADPAVPAPTVAVRPARFGLAAKLFAILILLGAVAVLITGVLGYVRARDALEQTIFNQLTSARETKAHQVEIYFRSIRNEMRLLAASKMVVDAMRGFRDAVDELDARPVPTEVRQRVLDWYDNDYMPRVRRLLGPDTPVKEFLPVGSAPYFLQDWYIVDNPYPKDRRKLVDDAGDGGAYNKLHAIYHPLMRTAAATLKLRRLPPGRPPQQPHHLLGREGSRVRHVAARRSLPDARTLPPPRRAAARRRIPRRRAWRILPTTCRPMARPGLHGGTRDRPGRRDRRPGGAAFDRRDRQYRDRRPALAAGRPRRDRRGLSGRARLPRPLQPARMYFENRDVYFAELKASGTTPDKDIEDIRRYGTPVLQQRVDTTARRAALGGVEGTGEIVGYRGMPTLASWGPVAVLRRQMGADRQDRHVGGLRADRPARARPHDRGRHRAAGRDRDRRLAVALAARAAARAHRRRARASRRATPAPTCPVRTRDEIGQLCLAFNGMIDEISEKNIVIENKNRENEELLLNVLPAPIANRLRGGEQGIADGFAEVTVAFADLVGFTAMSSEMPPAEVVSLLNGLFTRFDEAAHELGIEKIKTVGDAYMAVCGMPVQVPDHAERMVRMAIRMVHITREHAMEHHVAMKLRVGINSGPVVAGVIGKSKYIYDLWGDTVNLASRMESGGMPDTIQVTRSVYEKLKDEFVFEPRGTIEVKGKGSVEAWLLKL